MLRELALANEQDKTGLSASTLYRFLRARGLTERQLLLDKATAHKKYEAEFANQIWQSDLLFGPWVQRPGGGKMQVFLQATLDDASRLIPHAQFYPNQGLDSFLDCLRQAIAARGMPTRLYMDNAKIYRSPQLARIAASIGILIVHTPPYQPEGRGKIERFFRSVREQFLASPRSQSPAVARASSTSARGTGSTPSITAANTAPCRPRRCCAGSATSNRSGNCRRPPICAVCSSIAWTGWCAAIPRSCCSNRFFEAPPHLAGKRIEVRFDPLDLTQVEIYCEGKPEGVARLVDAVVNGMPT